MRRRQFMQKRQFRAYLLGQIAGTKKQIKRLASAVNMNGLLIIADYSDQNPRNVGGEAIVRQPGIRVNQKMETGLTAAAIIAVIVLVVGGYLFNVKDWYTPPEWPKVMPSKTTP